MKFRAYVIVPLAVIASSLMNLTALGQTQSDLEQMYALSQEYLRLSQSGQYEAAGKTAERVASFVQQRFPQRDQYRASMYLAEARNNEGRYQESLDHWKQTIERLKDFRPQTEAERVRAIMVQGEGLRSIGICLCSLGRAQEAVPYGEATLGWWTAANVPEARLQSAGAQLGLGDIYRILHDDEKAAKVLQEAVSALEPMVRQEATAGTASHYLSVALNCLAYIDCNQGRYDLAEPRLRQALKLCVAVNGWENFKTAKVLDTFVRLYGEQGRLREAEQYCRAEVEVFEKSVGKEYVETNEAYLRLAQILNAQNRYAEAAALIPPVILRYEREFGTDNPRTAAAAEVFARILWVQDKFAEAEPLLKMSLAAQEKSYGSASKQLAKALILLALLKTSQGDAAESLRVLDRLAEIHRQQPLSPQELEHMHLARANALWLSGQREAAIVELDHSLAQVEFQSGYSSGAERERAEVIESMSASFAQAIHWQAELKDVSKLFLAIERAKARSFLDELRLKNVDLLAGLSAGERQIVARRESELRQQLTAAEQRFEALPDAGHNPSPQVIAQRKELVGAILQARDALYRHLADTRSASPIYRELLSNNAETATLAQFQQQLRDDDLVLAYSIGRFHSYVISIHHDGANFSPLELDDETTAALDIAPGPLTADALQKILQDEASGALGIISSAKRRDEKISDKLAALWQLLIPATDRAALTTGKVKLLTIIPDGPLALLPFETLVVSGAEDSDPQYLLDVGPPIAYAPSASVLLNLAKREKADGAIQQTLLTLGDPAYPQAGAAAQDAVDRQLGITRTADQFRAGLTPLPYTGWESTWVQQAFEKVGFKSEKLTGAGATEAAIRRDAPGREIIHLACHGMADQSYGNFFGALAVMPGKSGDSRDDGFLSMSEIYELDLTGCELAILSACETNYGPQQQGEGVWALSRGFLVAGSRRVIASNWVVDDQAGATLVYYFASYLAAKSKDASVGNVSSRDYAAALHQAKKNIRKEEKWSHPFYWSSLVLVGPE